MWCPIQYRACLIYKRGDSGKRGRRKEVGQETAANKASATAKHGLIYSPTSNLPRPPSSSSSPPASTPCPSCAYESGRGHPGQERARANSRSLLEISCEMQWPPRDSELAAMPLDCHPHDSSRCLGNTRWEPTRGNDRVSTGWIPPSGKALIQQLDTRSTRYQRCKRSLHTPPRWGDFTWRQQLV